MMKSMKMKLVGLMLLVPLFCQAQKSLFNTYSDMKGVSSVYISKAMIEMNSNLFTKDVYIGKVSGKLDGVQIISTMDNNIKKNMRKDIQSLVHSSKYELLMKQKGIVSSSEFYVSRKGDKVRELIMVIDGAASLKFVYLEGEMTLKDIQNIMMYQNTSMNGDYISNDPFDSRDLASLKSLESLGSLGDLKDLDKLKELKKMGSINIKMNSKDWKNFEKQMDVFGKQMEAWGEEFGDRLGESIEKSIEGSLDN